MVTPLMLEPSQQLLQHAQRVQVEMQTDADEKRVAIRLESFDDGLGWYSSGSLTLPLAQLPLLEQAIAEMRRSKSSREDDDDKIIPFPGLN